MAVTFTNDVPADATLNVNGKGAKSIVYKGSAITANTIKANDTITFCYDGTNYVITSLGGEIPTFTGATSSANGSKGLVPAPLVADKDKFLKGDGTWGVAGGKLTVQTGVCTKTVDTHTSSADTKHNVYTIPLTLQEFNNIVSIQCSFQNGLTANQAIGTANLYSCEGTKLAYCDGFSFYSNLKYTHGSITLNNVIGVYANTPNSYDRQINYIIVKKDNA